MKRRDFVKTLGATGVALYASDLVGDLLAQSPTGARARVAVQGPVGHRAAAKPSGWAARYADVRFTRNISDASACATSIVTGGGGFGGGGREESAGFGVRVIHSGVWGFASSPFVTEDEIKKITRAGHRGRQGQRRQQALRGASSRRRRAYIDYWAVPVKINPDTVSLDDKIAFLMKINEPALKQPDVMRVQSQIAFDFEWKYLATSEGSYHRAGNLAHVPELQRHRAQGQPGQAAHLHRAAAHRRLRGRARRQDARERRAHRRRGGRALHGAAGRRRPQGPDHDAVARDAHHPRDRRARHRARSHRRLRGQLRRHELREDRATSAS